jgi:hypothetical protein
MLMELHGKAIVAKKRRWRRVGKFSMLSLKTDEKPPKDRMWDQVPRWRMATKWVSV